MSWWSRDMSEGSADIDLAYPPDSGGMVKKTVLGFGLAGYLLYLAVSIWVHQYAWLPDRNGSGQAIKGPGAQAAAVITLGAALFCHARWFWGLREGCYWTFERLTILASFIMIGGMGAVIWFELFN